MGTTASPDATTAPDREVLTWEGFGDASRELTQQIVDSGWIPDLIVARPAPSPTRWTSRRSAP